MKLNLKKIISSDFIYISSNKHEGKKVHENVLLRFADFFNDINAIFYHHLSCKQKFDNLCTINFGLINVNCINLVENKVQVF